MKWSLTLGRLFGVRIEVHWTFVFIIIWVVYSELTSGGTLYNALLSTLFIVLLFACVVLHEFGHILTAKKFGASTKKITLLPIGGIASLDKIPENPSHELQVAIAGPIVNIIIALCLLVFVPFKALSAMDSNELAIMLEHITLQNFVLSLFAANIVLAVFNFIPAFPMDGGRMFRALLAMKMGRLKATRIAAGLGQFLAMIFFFIGLFYNPFLIFIGIIIFIGAYGENEFVHREALITGHTVREAMLTNISTLSPDDTIADVIKMILAGTEKDFVVTENGHISGLLYHRDIIDNSSKTNTAVKEIMSTSFTPISIDRPLKQVFQMISTQKKNFFPVVENDRLVGAIDLSNLSEFILIKARLIEDRKTSLS